jgi:hypothetical protein
MNAPRQQRSSPGVLLDVPEKTPDGYIVRIRGVAYRKPGWRYLRVRPLPLVVAGKEPPVLTITGPDGGLLATEGPGGLFNDLAIRPRIWKTSLNPPP